METRSFTKRKGIFLCYSSKYYLVFIVDSSRLYHVFLLFNKTLALIHMPSGTYKKRVHDKKAFCQSDKADVRSRQIQSVTLILNKHQIISKFCSGHMNVSTLLLAHFLHLFHQNLKRT